MGLFSDQEGSGNAQPPLSLPWQTPSCRKPHASFCSHLAKPLPERLVCRCWAVPFTNIVVCCAVTTSSPPSWSWK